MSTMLNRRRYREDYIAKFSCMHTFPTELHAHAARKMWPRSMSGDRDVVDSCFDEAAGLGIEASIKLDGLPHP
jgi:hypothetical protein